MFTLVETFNILPSSLAPTPGRYVTYITLRKLVNKETPFTI